MRHVFAILFLSAFTLLAGCDKSTANGPPATTSQTAAPAPAAPTVANTESTQPTSAPTMPTTMP